MVCGMDYLCALAPLRETLAGGGKRGAEISSMYSIATSSMGDGQPVNSDCEAFERRLFGLGETAARRGQSVLDANVRPLLGLNGQLLAAKIAHAKRSAPKMHDVLLKGMKDEG